jgi:hypothetical protein
MKFSLKQIYLMLVFIAAISPCGKAALGRDGAQSPLPAPTGPYSVGRTQFDWIDESRPDPDMPSEHREIVVWVWYPASLKKGTEPAEWVPGKWGELLAQWIEKAVPGAIEQNQKNPIADIRSHSYTNAPFSSAMKKYPVLLFEPGSGVIPLIYATLIEDLVSHGYVVAGIVPTYCTGFTVLSGGRVITVDKWDAPPPADSHPTRTSPDDQEVPLPDGTTVYLTQKEMGEYTEVMGKYMNSWVHLYWTQDMTFTLNQLEKLNADVHSSFDGRLDFKELGAFGHSLGGAASVQVAKEDSRVRVAIDIDGTLRGNVVEGGLLKPVLLLTEPGEDSTFSTVLEKGKPAYRLILAGSQHFFSTDMGQMPFLSKEDRAKASGSIDPTRALMITKAYVEAFFGEYLEGKKSPLLDGPSPEYPEITFKTNKK